ncbi:RHS repeat-associated core domain-containing protein [Corallococcus exiguus]|uniref:RHS repeat-associated core domain-containing protein n=1 Tax=Corallococcus exiguus TaxID=83462 RepID=UPI001560B7A0|nr:RHS repeat-associated core domain-containing protein [Corallococcus exiguus]NRD44298.1 VCBS repeat-containing protein [Corallococcus exiguus]
MLLGLVAACGVSTGGADPVPSLVQAKEQKLDNSPLVVPSDTIVATERAYAGTVAGQVKTSFDVSPNGEALYDVPLWMPPGRAGMAPALSLAYRSRGGNGLLGMGWNITGLSEITRCRKTFAQDQMTAPIRFTADDALCLDGQRLVAIGSTSGATIEYRTEVESFAKVIAHDVVGGTPSWFEVFRKDGRIFSYGRFPETNSQYRGSRVSLSIEPVNGGVSQSYESSAVILSWGLSRVSDRAGNYFQVYYTLTGTPAGGYEQVPNRIEYTGHVSDTQGSLRRRAVMFEYEPTNRPDSEIRYVGGLKLVSTKRLHRILMYGPGLGSTATTRDDELLRSYEFVYRNDSITRRSLLRRTFECDGEGACRDPLEFDYDSGFDCSASQTNDCEDPVVQRNNFKKMTATEAINGGAGGYLNIQDMRWPGQGAPNGAPIAGVQDFWTLETLDINGDGRDDLLYRRNDDAKVVGNTQTVGEGTWYYRLATASPAVFSEPRLAGLPKSKTGNSDDDLRIVDMDGDGIPEILALQPADGPAGQNGYFQLYKFDGLKFQPANIQANETFQFWFNQSAPANVAGRIPVMHVADLNGDGLPELFRSTQQPQPNAWGFRLNQGGLVLSDYQQLDMKSGIDHSGFAVDVDGDGSTEVLVRKGHVQDGSATPVDNFSAPYLAVGVGMVGIPRVTTTTLSGLPTSQTVYNGAYHYDRTWFVDINGDGLPDAVSVRRDRVAMAGELFLPGNLRIAINTGNGFLPPQNQQLEAIQQISPSWLSLYGRNLDSGVRILDFDHDGRQDLLLTDSGENNGYGPNGIRTSQWVLLGRDDHFEARELTLEVPVGLVAGGPTSNIPYGFGQRFSRLFDVNGDGFQDLIQVEPDPSLPPGTGEHLPLLKVYVRQGRLPDVMTGSREGKSGRQVRVRYQHQLERPAVAGQPPVYTPGTCLAPQSCVRSGQWMVVEAGVEDGTGTGHFNNTFYSYESSRMDLQGRGWLGFAKRTSVSASTGARTTTTYDNQTRTGTLYLHAGLPQTETSEITLANGVKHIKEKIYRYTVKNSPEDRPYVFAHQVVETYLEGLGNDPPITKRNIQTIALDDYGNLKETQRIDDELSAGAPTGRTWLEGTYRPTIDNNTSAWLLGMVREVRVGSVAIDGADETRTTTHDYDPVTGFLVRTISEPGGGADFELKTEYKADAFGLVERVTRSSQNSVRVESQIFDTLEHIFVATSYNAANHRTRFAHHPGLGVTAIAEDPNGLVTRFRYDGFGRLRATLPVTGANKTLQYGVDPSGAMKITASLAGGQQVVTTFDNHGREVRKETRGFDGTVLSVSSVYDSLGRQVMVSRPRGSSGPQVFTHTEYDLLDRPLSVETPEGTTVSYVYDNLTTKVTDERGNRTSSRRDGRGQLVFTSSFMNDGREIPTAYEYGPFGVLSHVRDSKGHVIDILHDRLGRKTQVSDPDTGVTIQDFNAFGEIRREEDGSGKVTTFDEYDSLGRNTKLTNSDGVTQFFWDTSMKGALGSSVSPDGVTITHWYNALGQLSESDWGVNGATYRINRTYDTMGRLTTLSYPEVAGQRLVLRHGYTAYGHLKDVRDDVTQHVYWAAQSQNEYGQLTAERLGNGILSQRRYDSRGRLRFIDSRVSDSQSPFNGQVRQGLSYEWDVEGNLKSRSDLLAQTTEDFEYDALDRLTKWASSQNCRRSVLEYRYDDLGNLLERRVLEGSGTATNSTYPIGPVRPHAVTQSLAGAYTYEDNGNQLTGPGRTVTYTAFDLPSHISGGGRDVTFKYDATQARTVKTSSLSGTTTYVGGLYEKRQANGETVHVFNIAGGERVVAQLFWEESSGAVTSEQPLYLLGDHLGSTETVTNLAANVVERQKFEPFGGRRQPYALPIASSVASGAVRIGFTSHETDDEFGLVNMGGRIYDPETARFITPDPFVQFPQEGQAFNRYAYVMNNPLRWTDPSGFNADDALPNAGSVTTEVLAPAQPPPTFAAGAGAAEWTGAPAPVVLSADQNGTSSSEARLKSNVIQQRGNIVMQDLRTGRTPRTVKQGIFTEYELEVARREFVMDGVRYLAKEYLIYMVLNLVTDGAAGFIGRSFRAPVKDVSWALEKELLKDGATLAADIATAAPVLKREMDLLAVHAKNIPASHGGYFNVVTHANSESAEVIIGWKQVEDEVVPIWESRSHRQLAKLIETSEGYSGGPVRLIACHAGCSENGWVQDLANKLGVEVLAPTDYAYVSAHGAYWTDGIWRVFQPGKH